ncbi:hypothetical protein ACM78Z_27215, partial [Pseudomonas aeruginosa]
CEVTLPVNRLLDSPDRRRQRALGFAALQINIVAARSNARRQGRASHGRFSCCRDALATLIAY